jgi:hypothetical protein
VTKLSGKNVDYYFWFMLMAKVYQENELMGIKNELEKPADWH